MTLKHLDYRYHCQDRENQLISKRRMGEFDALCRLDVHDMTPQQIKALREKARVSQSVFAAVLNTSPSTVQKWEIGAKKPSGPSLKLLNLIESKGLDAVLLPGRETAK